MEALTVRQTLAVNRTTRSLITVTSCGTFLPRGAGIPRASVNANPSLWMAYPRPEAVAVRRTNAIWILDTVPRLTAYQGAAATGLCAGISTLPE